MTNKKDVKWIDPREFQDFGFLLEVNRRFLHPLGLALAIDWGDGDQEPTWAGVWDYRDDPEGLYFSELDDEDQKKRHRVSSLWAEKAVTRQEKLGYVIQPFAKELVVDAVDLAREHITVRVYTTGVREMNTRIKVGMFLLGLVLKILPAQIEINANE
jgi:hypothetical protein